MQCIQHDDIDQRLKQHKGCLNGSESMRPELKDHTNKIVLVFIKDGMRALTMTDFIAITTRVYSITNNMLTKFNELNIQSTDTFRQRFSKVVAQPDINT